jgi:hypothetical protein
MGFRRKYGPDNEAKVTCNHRTKVDKQLAAKYGVILANWERLWRLCLLAGFLWTSTRMRSFGLFETYRGMIAGARATEKGNKPDSEIVMDWVRNILVDKCQLIWKYSSCPEKKRKWILCSWRVKTCTYIMNSTISPREWCVPVD